MRRLLEVLEEGGEVGEVQVDPDRWMGDLRRWLVREKREGRAREVAVMKEVLAGGAEGGGGHVGGHLHPPPPLQGGPGGLRLPRELGGLPGGLGDIRESYGDLLKDPGGGGGPGEPHHEGHEGGHGQARTREGAQG